MSSEHDVFDSESFGDPIDEVCLDALVRLHTFAGSRPSPLESGDVLVERFEGFDGAYPKTVLNVFAAAFDVIHNNMMTERQVPAYLRTIVSYLVAKSISIQTDAAGNAVTQLLPTTEALDHHVDRMWELHSKNRTTGSSFTIFNFHSGQGVASVRFQPDQSDSTWTVGYGMEIHRTLLRVHY